ncbi:DUF4012 domain-containing protein [Curtobacterium sp. MCBA15_001]|uniref:DUF4012 domain-containing protein n=1 Tax=Curtobacterium sp. MCBA15_001 TaxID=1898731 RepID=UPI0008DCC8C4|nr:DUF4012 domain-containing protein [Curtobacterium sp. MCBA15_001]OIH97608.1 hypothetical protein BIU90_13580 [Curtobacterium sp. MCBA15_001]
MSDLSETRSTPVRSRSKRRFVLWACLVIALVVLAAVAWVAVRGLAARSALEESVASVEQLRTQLANGDVAGVDQTARRLEDSAARARAMTADPVWGAFQYTPLLGSNFRAVREITVVVDDVATGAVRPVAGVVGDIDISSLAPKNGRVELRPLVDAAPAVSRATKTLHRADENADAIDTSETLSVVNGAVDQLRSSLGAVSQQAALANRVVQLAPAMLGDGGTKHYLVLFQNNAELRAGGGIPGAVAEVTASDGALALGQQASTADFPERMQPVLPLSTDTQGLYGSITGEYIQDVTLTPRFELSARLAREMWKQQYGTEVDGVVAIDPVTLGYILRATGPVSLATGDQLTADNAVPLLLSEAYAKYQDPRVQDAFFASAASAVFAKVSSGGFDPTALIEALTTAASEDRLRLWSADSGQQSLISGTAVAGDLLKSDRTTQRFGVYLNDATGAKMDYYLQKAVSVGSSVCRNDGRPTWVVEVTLENSAPADAGATLPDYVTGAENFGVPRGSVRTNVAVYAPPAGVLLASVQDGKPAAPQTALDGVYPVTQFQTLLAPGQKTTLRLEFLGPEDSARTPVAASSTPGVRQSVTKPLTVDCQSPLG